MAARMSRIAGADGQRACDPRILLNEFRVAHHQPVVGVEQREAFRHRLDGLLENPAGVFGPRLGVPLARDVLAGAAITEKRAVRGVIGPAAVAHPVDLARGGDHRVLEIAERLARDDRGEMRLPGGGIGADVADRLAPLAEQPGGVDTEHAGEILRYEGQPSVGAGFPNPVGRELDEIAQPHLAGAEYILAGDLHRHVLDHEKAVAIGGLGDAQTKPGPVTRLLFAGLVLGLAVYASEFAGQFGPVGHAAERRQALGQRIQHGVGGNSGIEVGGARQHVAQAAVREQKRAGLVEQGEARRLAFDRGDQPAFENGALALRRLLTIAQPQKSRAAAEGQQCNRDHQGDVDQPAMIGRHSSIPGLWAMLLPARAFRISEWRHAPQAPPCSPDRRSTIPSG